MIYIILSILITFLLIASARLSKVAFMYILPYLVIWWTALCFSMIGLYGLYVPSEKTILILSAHVLCFVTGFCVVCSRQHYIKDFSNNQLKADVEKLCMNHYFITILGVSLAYIVYKLSIFFNIVMAQAWMDARSMSFSGELYGKFFGIIDSVLLAPLNMVCLAIASFSVANKKCFTTWLALAFVIVYASLLGGRQRYLDILLAVLFYFCVNRPQRYNLSKKRKWWPYVLVGAAVYFSLSVISARKMGDEGKLIETYYNGSEILNEQGVTYIAGPVVAFHSALEKHYENKLDGYQYGRVSMSMVEDALYLLSLPPHALFHTKIYIPRITEVAALTQETIDVGGSFSWNALYTSCLYYYLDFGVFGVLFLPFLFGMFTGLIFKKFEQYQNFPYFILTCMIFVIMCNTVQRLFMYNMWNFLIIILMPLLSKKHTKSVKVNL